MDSDSRSLDLNVGEFKKLTSSARKSLYALLSGVTVTTECEEIFVDPKTGDMEVSWSYEGSEVTLEASVTENFIKFSLWSRDDADPLEIKINDIRRKN